MTIATRPFNREALVPAYILLTDHVDLVRVDDDEPKSFRRSMDIHSAARYKRATSSIYNKINLGRAKM